MSKSKPKVYREEFKKSSAALAAKSDSSIKEVASRLGVPPATLHGWVMKYCPNDVKPSGAQAEIADFNGVYSYIHLPPTHTPQKIK